MTTILSPSVAASPREAAYSRGGRGRDDVSPRGQQWQNPSIVLKSRRTNVRPNSSINLQVNQGYLPLRPAFFDEKRRPRIRIRIRRRRASFYALDRRVCRVSDSTYIHTCVFTLAARMHISAYTRVDVTYTRTCSGVYTRENKQHIKMQPRLCEPTAAPPPGVLTRASEQGGDDKRHFA